MATCVVCGKETNGNICDSCKKTVDIEKLCIDIIGYRPGSGENELWEKIASKLESPYDFKNISDQISEVLPSPRKEYIRILSAASLNSNINVRKDKREWLYEVYEQIKDTDGLSSDELLRIKGLVLGALFMDYRYEEAEALASELMEHENLHKYVYCNLADFYIKTRRYDVAVDIIDTINELYSDDIYIKSSLVRLKGDYDRYLNNKAKGKEEFMPKPKENKEQAQKAYIDLLESIGIEYTKSISQAKNKEPVPIPKDQYPTQNETRNANIDTFVAFDFETTGINSKFDCIVEIGAIKVVGDRIVDSAEFTFQEFVRPYKRKISVEAEKLHGITMEDVKNARQMWEVIPDFKDFIGDNVLVGFNSISFDSKLLVRAGRYAHVIIENPHFDVMKYATNYKDELGLSGAKISLGDVASKLNIKNSKAHRALSDAITTAKVFLKLKEMDNGKTSGSIDDVLDDIDKW
jgi:DNA polymerase-3 subunit alpha (Gram-positive type)